ncbi:50 kDa surface antigen [Babesia divergens]|uniref:50 kDa surface antigen n=1 Tax=Babesia divergens TaxID=32595 RepID=A0AAD9GFP5_BABDI|nr:50 kDa surface antigen [Babesia divergens]
MMGFYGILLSLAAVRLAVCTEQARLTTMAPKHMTLKDGLEWVHGLHNLYKHTKDVYNKELQELLSAAGMADKSTEMEEVLADFMTKVDELRTLVLSSTAEPAAPTAAAEGSAAASVGSPAPTVPATEPTKDNEKSVKALFELLPSLYDTLNTLLKNIEEWKKKESFVDGQQLINKMSNTVVSLWFKDQGYTVHDSSKVTLAALEEKVMAIMGTETAPHKKLLVLYSIIVSLTKPEKVVPKLVWLYSLGSSVNASEDLQTALKTLVEAKSAGKGEKLVEALKELTKVGRGNPLYDALSASVTLLGEEAAKVERFTMFNKESGTNYLTLLIEMFKTLEDELAELNTLLKGKTSVTIGSDDAEALGKKGFVFTSSAGTDVTTLQAKYATLLEAESPLSKFGKIVKEIAESAPKEADESSLRGSGSGSSSSFAPVGISILMASFVLIVA